MDKFRRRADGHGPLSHEDVHPGDRYELSDGRAIYCAPTGGDGARGVAAGLEVLDTDPDVDSAGMDPGYALRPGTLRAPDIAVGAVPDAPGWIHGAPPPLAVEYASLGQDESELRAKITDLLGGGTRFVWVVRLLGPRRVEVHQPGKPMHTLGPGEVLTAPGVLRNPVPVEAMYDRATAHKLTLRNLLQRFGYDGIEAVKAEGIVEGRAEGHVEGLNEGRNEGILQGLRDSLIQILQVRGLPVGDAERSQIAACTDPERLRTWLTRAITAAETAAIFG